MLLWGTRSETGGRIVLNGVFQLTLAPSHCGDQDIDDRTLALCL